mgnify:FL=1
MGFFNLLADLPITFLGQTFDISLNWIGRLINALIGGIGIVGVGIIVFSLILRCIVLPFDVFQRISMRKQNVKMKENKEKLDKLQKQYANDKKMYSQKMMELQKEQGFSLLSSCLPMILSLVIFFVAMDAFNAYSSYANLQNYNLLVEGYNAALQPYVAEITEDNIDDDYEIVGSDGNPTAYIRVEEADVGSDGNPRYIYFLVPYAENYAENDYAYIRNFVEKQYYVSTDKAYADLKEEIDAVIAASVPETPEGEEETPADPLTVEEACVEYFVSLAQDNVVRVYETEVTDRMSFGWIKNIWVTDASYRHPVLNYSDFRSGVSRESLSVNGGSVSFNNIGNYTDAYNQGSYDVVTEKLSAQKNQANGYFILIALSIGTILLQQFVSMRSQKEQTKYSSVDGQAASTQKITLVIMTLMFAVFSFMYSAAFSIYMVTSNILSLIMTIVINKAVDVAMRKKEERELQEQYNKRFPGRVYVPSADKEKKEKQAAKEAPAQGKGTRQSMRGLKSKGADGKENKAAEDGKDKDKK